MKSLPVFVGLILIVSLIACTVTDQARGSSASTAMTPVAVTNQPSDNIMVKVILQERKQWRFGDLVFDNRFSGARLNDLVQEPDGRFTVFIDPETAPINPSPWYAFTIYSSDARTITLDVKIRYTEKGKPLVSNIAPWVRSATRPGAHLPSETWTKGTERTSTILRLDPGINLVTAFDPVTLEEVLAWQTSMQLRPNVTASVIGSSIEGRPIEQFTISEASTPDQHYLILIGGQHPPEITGNRGLRHFVNALCATTEPAVSFRARFRVVVIPMINPDGKYHGHWRTNLAGIDLNRDWVEFQQPETRAVRDYLITLGKKPGVTLHAMIDFHSVYRNMMYIQEKDATARLADFTASWLGNLEKNHGRQMVTEYDNGVPASKRWFMTTFGNNGYTREFAYLDQDDVIRRQAEQEAEEMMKLLLQRVVATP